MLSGVQAIRAWAAIAVMIFHLGGALAAPKYFDLTALMFVTGFGTHGVLLFFVLSGFIIHHVHGQDLGHPERVGRYLFRRFMRIYPIYWVPLLLVAFFALASGVGAEGMPTDLLVIAKTILLVPQDKAVVGGTGAPVLIVAWSLQYEILFYLAFALCIAHLRLGLVAIVGFLIVMISLQQSGHSSIFPAYMAWVDFALFAMGIAASRMTRLSFDEKAARMTWWTTLVLVGLCWISQAVAGLATNGTIHLFGGMTSRLLLGILAMLLITSRAVLDINRPEKGGSVVGYIADCSYLIYLVHFPVISAACKLTLSVGLGGGVGAATASLLAVAGTLALSALLHETVEKPVLAFARRVGSPTPRLSQ